MGKKTKQQKFDPQHLLNETFNLSNVELRALRNHVMPERQQIQLRDKRRSNKGSSFASQMLAEMSIYILGPIICGFLALLNTSVPAVSVIVIIAILVGTPLVLMIMFRQHAAISRDLANKRVESVEGRIQLHVGHLNSYWLNVDGLSLRLDEVSFTAFRNGDPYMIYYAPESKIVLAAEWIDDAQYDQIFED